MTLQAREYTKKLRDDISNYLLTDNKNPVRLSKENLAYILLCLELAYLEGYTSK